MKTISIKGILVDLTGILIIVNGDLVWSPGIITIYYLWIILRDQSDISYSYLVCMIVIHSIFICRLSMNSLIVCTSMYHMIQSSEYSLLLYIFNNESQTYPPLRTSNDSLVSLHRKDYLRNPMFGTSCGYCGLIFLSPHMIVSGLVWNSVFFAWFYALL